MISCGRPSKMSASDTFPSGLSKTYSLSISTIGRLRRSGVGPGRTGGVVEAHAQDDGATHPARSAHSTGDAVDDGHGGGVYVRVTLRTPPDGVLGPDRTPPLSDLDGSGVAVVGQCVQ